MLIRHVQDRQAVQGWDLQSPVQFVIMHGGVIKVYSKENEGTTFTVKISLKHSDAKNPAVEQVESKTTTQRLMQRSRRLRQRL